ncbi:MAG: superoxide dismutase family protein [Flavobacteriaceae bacterium]|nr:superoxide dismutase family protein [Flavobacteriaceae bacterium]
MKKMQWSLLGLSLLAFMACKNDAKKSDTEEEVEKVVEEVEVKEITLLLESRSGSSATGKVSLTDENGVVTLVANLSGLDAGTHAIHFHEKADCSAADGTSTGGHWNPTFEPHGKWGDNEGGYHKGDIGNFEVGEDGTGTIEMSTSEWCLGCGDEKKDLKGKAIIVHQGADDFVSQPSGAAGARVSCGGIVQ